jgi:hypothetical protein
MSDQNDVSPQPAGKDQALMERLRGSRPVPPAGFRGDLGRSLAAQDPGYGPRPLRLRLISAGLLVGSTMLLGLAALQATGAI